MVSTGAPLTVAVVEGAAPSHPESSPPYDSSVAPETTVPTGAVNGTCAVPELRIVILPALIEAVTVGVAVIPAAAHALCCLNVAPISVIVKFCNGALALNVPL